MAAPFFKKECSVFLKNAKSRGIPVVFLDTEVKFDDEAYFIRQNSHIAGKVAARLLHGLVGNKGKYSIVNMGIQVNNKQREDGFRAYFESIGQEVEIKSINHALKESFKVTKEMESWFKGDHLKGIFITNSRAYLIPEIISKYNVTNTFLVGFDLSKKNLKYLENDRISFLINQQPKYQGYVAIKSLFNFLTKQDDSELDLDIPIEINVKEHFV